MLLLWANHFRCITPLNFPMIHFVFRRTIWNRLYECNFVALKHSIKKKNRQTKKKLKQTTTIAGICVTILSYILYKVKQKMNKLSFDASYQTIDGGASMIRCSDKVEFWEVKYFIISLIKLSKWKIVSFLSVYCVRLPMESVHFTLMNQILLILILLFFLSTDDLLIFTNGNGIKKRNGDEEVYHWNRHD